MTLIAQRLNYADTTDYTAAAALVDGQIIQMADGRAAVVTDANGIASGSTGTVTTTGRYAVASASATTFSVGDPVWFDLSTDKAITSSALGTQIYLGTAAKAKIATELVVEVNLGGVAALAGTGLPMWSSAKALMVHDDATEHTIIQAAQNPRGLIVHAFMGLVTEAPAGSSEDQLIIDLSDSDDNVLSQITTTDTSPDAAGDLVFGTLCESQAVTDATQGFALAVIPAGKSAYLNISQATAGTPAGEVTCWALVHSL